jgi:hypothetical protein
MSEWTVKLRQAFAGLAHQYKLTFRSPPGQIVLKDLARFCRAHESTFHDNERIQSKLDGRREVWLHIQELIKLSDDELWDLYKGRREQ